LSRGVYWVKRDEWEENFPKRFCLRKGETTTEKKIEEEATKENPLREGGNRRKKKGEE